MGKSDHNSALPGQEHLERAMEVLDEDHLEFEEILLNLQERAERIETQFKHLSEKVAESCTETLESREMIENLEVKIDRLLAIISEWRRERLE
jgi:predicted  nucleic acid-binding Zn-ribbon protein